MDSVNLHWCPYCSSCFLILFTWHPVINMTEMVNSLHYCPHLYRYHSCYLVISYTSCPIVISYPVRIDHSSPQRSLPWQGICITVCATANNSLFTTLHFNYIMKKEQQSGFVVSEYLVLESSPCHLLWTLGKVFLCASVSSYVK